MSADAGDKLRCDGDQADRERRHREEPWRRARQGLRDTARSSAIIDPAVMERYHRTQEENGRGPAALAISP